MSFFFRLFLSAAFSHSLLDHVTHQRHQRLWYTLLLRHVYVMFLKTVWHLYITPFLYYIFHYIHVYKYTLFMHILYNYILMNNTQQSITNIQFDIYYIKITLYLRIHLYQTKTYVLLNGTYHSIKYFIY